MVAVLDRIQKKLCNKSEVLHSCGLAETLNKSFTSHICAQMYGSRQGPLLTFYIIVTPDLRMWSYDF